MNRLLVVLGVSLLGCVTGDELPPVLTPDAPLPIDDDVDNDGVVRAQDCNDEDETVFPGAQELCDAVDNNCDGVMDENTATFEDATGVRDVSNLFIGTAALPARISFPTAGKLQLCGASTYFAAITVAKNLEIVGTGAETSILDGGGKVRVITTETQGTTTTIRDVRLANGTATTGGALYCADTTVDVRDVVIANNSASGRGAGVALDRCTSNFNRVTISDNAGASGAGLSALSGTATLTNVTLTKNAATTVGGGLSSTTGAVVNLIDSIVLENSSGNGQGGGAFIDGTVSCNTTTFNRNTGNGVFLTGNAASFTSTLCSFGVAAAANNTPADLVPGNGVPLTPVNRGDTVSFNCTSTACQ
jgi:hypothetical protein